MLIIKSLTKTFKNKKILDQISLTVPHGKIALLLGQSGTGKSTLLRILSNLEKADSGSVECDGKPLKVSNALHEHTVGMVFQNFNLFDHMSVQENITLPLEKVMHLCKADADAIAHTLLTQYGLLDKANQSTTQLSGGQKQRLAIARTLALKPRVICLDEPTSALDPSLSAHVAAIIQKLADDGYIVVVATHDVALIDRLDCMLYLMKDGRIIESALSADFLQRKTDYPLLSNFVAGTP